MDEEYISMLQYPSRENIPPAQPDSNDDDDEMMTTTTSHSIQKSLRRQKRQLIKKLRNKRQNFSQPGSSSIKNDNYTVYTNHTSFLRKRLHFRKRQNNALPEKFDWRDLGLVTSPEDQGNCDSCWAFAVTTTIETQYAYKHRGNLTRLSKQQLLDCYSPNLCRTGYWTFDVIFYIKFVFKVSNL